MASMQPDPNPSPRPAAQAVNLKKIEYFLGEVERRELSIALIRAKLIGDTGIGASARFADDPPTAGFTGPDQESWRGSGKGKKQDFRPPPESETAKFDKEIGRGEQAQAARKVEVHAQVRFGSIEAFLKHLHRENGEGGYLPYPQFSLAQYAQTEGLQQMALEVAKAFAEVLIDETRTLKDNFTGNEKEAAIELIAQRVLGRIE